MVPKKGGSDCSNFGMEKKLGMIMIKKIKKIFQLNKSEDFETESVVDGILRRKYKSYYEYTKKQAEKLNNNFDVIKTSDLEYENIVYDRYSKTSFDFKNKMVLCLAARLGGEVPAFKRLGALAIGIDLNPGPNNKDVLTGDFHNVQFPNNSFDFCFTNSVDHVYNLESFCNEIKRLLKDDGILIIEFARVALKKESYEVIDTTNLESLLKYFTQHFKFIKTEEVINKTDYINWNGQLYYFKNMKKAAKNE